MNHDRVPIDSSGIPARGVKGESIGQVVRTLTSEGRVLELAATGRPIATVLATLIDTIEIRMEGSRGTVLLLSADGQHLVHGAAPSVPAEYCRAIDGVRIGPAVGSCGTAAYRGERVVVTDIQQDPLWTDFRKIAARFGLAACWSQPILSSSRKVLGTLAMYYERPRKPSRAELDYLEIAAHLASIAIEKSQTETRRRAADQRLLKQKAVLVDLVHSEPLLQSDFRAFARLATETAAETLGVDRVGIWLFDETRSRLRQSDLYELSADRHTSGIEILAKDCPRYFSALERGRAVVAHDARSDLDTSEFAETYLVPNGITSMLDAPIRRAGKLSGVVCHEHVGPARVWAADEQEFAASIGDMVSLVQESADRRKAEQAFRSAQEELLRQQWQARQQIEFDLKRAEEELVKQTRLAAAGQVAASIAHELRNPLGAMRNAAYLLGGDVVSDEKRAEYLDVIEYEIGIADRIVEDLLEMSHSRTPVPDSVDLGDAVERAWFYAGADSDVELRCDFDPEPFAVWVDPHQLRQVLGNLLANAVEATERRGVVAIVARKEDGRSVVRVTDSGPGVDPQYAERIFEPLFTTKVKGTGLGLATCRQIAKNHGGSIGLRRSDASGACFELVLPEPSR